MKTLRLMFAAALALCATLVFAAESDPPAVVGRLSHISGPVSFAPAEANEDFVAATLNRPITTGDRLWTDTNGRAEVHVGSLAIRMAPQTSMDVLNLDDQNFQLRVAQGAVNLRVRRLSSDKLLEIATPGGAVVIKQPGSYRVNVDSSGAATMVAVRNGGQADVFTGNTTFTVRDDQEAEVSGSRQGLYAAPPLDDFDRWTAERDRRSENVASTRYVPEEMTGYEDLDQHGAWRTAPEYGPVWVPRAVPTGWAPYSQGHWVWVSPWGWTWVDDAPWGFAPFHYGRWIYLGNHWAWAPGRRVVQPVYSPAMVAFIGGSNFSVSLGIGSGPAVGWVPLGWREPYRPWYRASHNHVRNVNVTHVTNVTNITNVTNVRLVNRTAPSAVTVVSRENFVGARRVQQAALKMSARQIAAAPVTQGTPVATPARASFAAAGSGSRPPAEVARREAVAVNAPPARARDVERADRKGKDRDEARVASRDNDDRPRVRVIDRQQRVELQAAPAPRLDQKGQVQAQQAKAGERVPDKAGPQEPQKAAPQPQPQAQGKASPVEGRGNERAQDKAAAQPQSAPQAERRAPGPPAEVSRRPTFDREMRETKRGERQAERQGERGDKAQQPADPRRQQAQDQQRGEPQQAERQRAQQQEQQQAERQKAQQQQQQQAAQERQAREQQTRQRGEQQQAERQKAQQQQQQQAAQERQAREQQSRQQAERQQAQQQRQQQAAQERQAREQQAERQKAQPQQQQQPRQQQRPQRENDARRAPQTAPVAEHRPQPQQRAEKGRDRQRAEHSQKG